MFTYFIQGPPLSPVKIGKAKDVESRVASLQTGSPHRLRVLRVLDGDFESEMHKRFASDRLEGEWFRWSPQIATFVAEPLRQHPAVWRMINAYCTDEERREFNQWRAEMHAAADAIRDWCMMRSMSDSVDYPQQIEQIMKLISDVPWLER